MKGLSAFVDLYVAGRRQAKLDVFDKAKLKRLAEGEDESQLLEERRELELRYETRAWLTDAANRAGQISLVTHAAKYTHGDSKSSSIFSSATATDGYLSTATLAKPAADAVGNAAALDVAKLLQTEIEGDSLLSCLQRGDRSALAELAENDEQLSQWVEGFSRALTTKQPTSHKLAKQIYFPVEDGYHLLNPLFSSSLAQALHERMVALRFSEESKAIWAARKDGKWHAQPLVMFPNLAGMNFGGTKPQNISALNSSRGGRVWLLPSKAPFWENQKIPPLKMKTIFVQGPFDRSTRQIRGRLIHLLISTGNTKNYQIRQQRNRYIDELIDLLFNLAADIQREEWSGWTQDENCQLKPHQQLWLDPWRAQTDEVFRAERDKDDWQDAVADDFALWLNSHLHRADMPVGQTERREWQTRPLFRRRLREMENALRSYRHE
ncbi:type I-F CRISPR-associated protein Csy1 [Enterobacter sp. R1(2018)]|uniref:type I-F CRISPR-associated protein Csy1 n=1 Tax=Enterobacter sp. R1(2018) TaxID=2447891 RepID=UPI000EADA513|nr:type I-F CRISPR-associated protein Csy1 [Enterobacter sp. R1(2018)]RKQ41017.1 type I-F CRISPR-associated protein Csy1 [Enterobacter sp. R1(2018)]